MASPKSRSFALRSLSLFLAGALVGPIGDSFHVLSGTDAYPAPAPGELRIAGLLPLWVPLLFGGAALGIGLGQPAGDAMLARLAARPVPGRPCAGGWACVAAGLAWLLAVWAASGFLPLATGGAKDAVIGAAALATWIALDRSWEGLALALVTAAISGGVEAALVRAGAFRYMPENSNLLGVPTWLPSLYVVAAITVGNLGRLLATAKAPAADPRR